MASVPSQEDEPSQQQTTTTTAPQSSKQRSAARSSQRTSHGSSRSGTSGRSAQRPQTFMFIDASQPGAPLKPDKAVRSFVMHQARRQRPWSTRKVPPAGAGPSIRPAGKVEDAEKSPEQEAGDADVVASPARKRRRKQSMAHRLAASTTTGADEGDHDAHVAVCSQPATPASPASPQHAAVCRLPSCGGERCGHNHHVAADSNGALVRRDGFALGHMDPFDSLAVPMDAQSSSLIDHFVTIFAPRLIPVDLRQTSKASTTGWLAGALQDSSSRGSITYAILSSTALHLHLMGAASLESVLYYKGLAISEINRNLASPETQISDNNIAAVFMLLTMEESMLAITATDPSRSTEEKEWTEKQKLIHLNGLRAMIQKRGGLSGLQTNRCLQIFLLMHSIAHSITSFHRPYTALLDSDGKPHQYDLSPPRPRSPSSRVLKLFKDLKIDAGLVDIVSDISAFTHDLSLLYSDRKCPLDPMDLQKHASLLMYRLYDWYDSGHSDGGEQQQERDSLDQCVCLALLIFVVRSAHPQDFTHRTMALSAVRRLRQALKKTSIFRWAKAPDLLLWTLTIGALAAMSSPKEMPFFEQYCQTYFMDAGGFADVPRCEDLLERMRRGLWIGSVLDEEASGMWVRIGVARPGEGDGDGEGMGTVDGLVEGFAALRTEVEEDDAVGLLTSNRFFTRRG